MTQLKQENSPRKITPLIEGWRFCRAEQVPVETVAWGNYDLNAGETRIWQKAGNHGISKSGNPGLENWRTVRLPHDFVLEGEFSPTASFNNGSLHGGKAWYVCEFELSETECGRSIYLEFDGVFRDCQVFVNGHFVGRHLSGYTGFNFEISEVSLFGSKNAVAVFVDATENELWSYEGGGIYREVRLVSLAPVHIPYSGIYFKGFVEENRGGYEIAVEIENRSWQNIESTVIIEITGEDKVKEGEILTCDSNRIVVAARETAMVTCMGNISSPRLWDTNDPYRYMLKVSIISKGVVVDTSEIYVGFRTLHFDSDNGFFLNGRSLKLKGVCCHQDHAGVGVAVPPALWEWRVRRLKEIGVNAIRTSHNPPDPAFLDVCDRLGVMVMDEIRLPGIARELREDLISLIRRDRNHPSVILWSIGNEEMGIQNTKTGIRIFSEMQKIVHQLDSTRLCTYAMNCDWHNIIETHVEQGFRIDVFGTNYRSDQKSSRYDDFHLRYPKWPMLGSETWGGTCTRGLYEPDSIEGTHIDPKLFPALAKGDVSGIIEPRRLNDPQCWLGDEHRTYASGYGNWITPWGYLIENAWIDCASRPFMAGTFLWTGFDYRGETTPYLWPAVVSRFGVLDLCGFYKEVAHYLRASWRPEIPYLFIMPHWNWEGEEGKNITVWLYGNVSKVELFLNDRSLGVKEMVENKKLIWSVPFAAGKLEARGFDKLGKATAHAIQKTAGSPSKIEMASEGIIQGKHGRGILVVDAKITDEQGTLCPRATNEVIFSVTGPARLIGIGNGNPLSHEPDQGTSVRAAYHGLCQAIYETYGEGTVCVKCSSAHLESAEISVDTL